jgi:hypothetical protein
MIVVAGPEDTHQVFFRMEGHELHKVVELFFSRSQRLMVLPLRICTMETLSGRVVSFCSKLAMSVLLSAIELRRSGIFLASVQFWFEYQCLVFELLRFLFQDPDRLLDKDDIRVFA